MKTIATNRRYDIDWLRVIAIGLLLIYHIAIGFQPWGVFIKFIQNTTSLEKIWIPMSMLNVWRIPLLFFVSGMGVCFAIKKRNWKQLMFERTKRIFIPFLFGALVIVPVHIYLWQKYYNQDVLYTPGQGHLWFLANIFIYVIALSPLFFYLKRNENKKIVLWLKKVFSNPLGIIIVTTCFVLESFMLKPEIYTLYAMTFHGFVLGFLAFLFGFIFVLSGDSFWQTILKWRWIYFIFALSFYLIRVIVFDLKAPNYLVAIESVFWIYSIFGFAFKYLNKPSKSLSYLSQAAYPIYILHMIFLYLASYFLFPLDMLTTLKFILTILITSLGCFITFEFVIRRVGFLRPLFGLKVLNVNQ